MENLQEQSTQHYYRKQMLRFILTYFSLVIPSILQNQYLQHYTVMTLSILQIVPKLFITDFRLILQLLDI